MSTGRLAFNHSTLIIYLPDVFEKELGRILQLLEAPRKFPFNAASFKAVKAYENNSNA